jgi:hypothetical protein
LTAVAPSSRTDIWNRTLRKKKGKESKKNYRFVYARTVLTHSLPLMMEKATKEGHSNDVTTA